MTITTTLLLDMLKYKRPEGSDTQKEFCDLYLKPIFGEPDVHGNYILDVRLSKSKVNNLMFCAHHDTVHTSEGLQELLVQDDIVSVVGSNCLGADCTTGIWLILGMIEANIPGVYVIHAGEEIGCIGSSALVKDYPLWLTSIDACVSFDRFGDSSIITHQMGQRTASEGFSKSFSDALGLPQLTSDSGGSYTDSNEYKDIISECTNVSVGYNGQHTRKETQDLDYCNLLLDHLIDADWSKLVFKRDPSVTEYDYYDRSSYDYVGGELRKPWDNEGDDIDKRMDLYHLAELVRDYPEEIAELFYDWGITPQCLLEEANIDDFRFVDFNHRKVG